MNVNVLIKCIVFINVCFVPKTLSDESTDAPNLKSIYDPSPYNLEDYCNTEDGKVTFRIDAWKGAIFQVGYIHDAFGIPKSRNIHTCKVEIKTSKDFWLVVAIEYMKIRGTRDANNKWQCSDYIKFSSPGRNIFQKIFKVLDLDFAAKNSEELCGEKKLDSENFSNIYDISTDANSFNTPSNELTMFFHQDNDDRHTVNNSFRIVVTTFRHASEEVECEGKQKCFGRDIYCIDKDFVCDKHINCAFPGSGTDERLCYGRESNDTFNITSVIIITLMSVITLGILICLISTFVSRIKARINNDQRSSTPTVFTSVPLSQHPTAPGFEPEETLPPYETVILSDAGCDKDKVGVEEGELPPKYDVLFPDGPPTSPKEDSGHPDR